MAGGEKKTGLPKQVKSLPGQTDMFGGVEPARKGTVGEIIKEESGQEWKRGRNGQWQMRDVQSGWPMMHDWQRCSPEKSAELEEKHPLVDTPKSV